MFLSKLNEGPLIRPMTLNFLKLSSFSDLNHLNNASPLGNITLRIPVLVEPSKTSWIGLHCILGSILYRPSDIQRMGLFFMIINILY